MRVHTVLFFGEKPDSHGFNTSVMRTGCVCACGWVCVCANTRCQTKARARRLVMIWLTSDLMMMIAFISNVGQRIFATYTCEEQLISRYNTFDSANLSVSMMHV